MFTKPNISFGTDGWRGLLDTEVNPKTMATVAQAFSHYLITHCKDKDKIKVAIGYDGRRDSKKFATLFARVLSGNNIIALLSDKIGPTPILSYYVKAKKLNAGVMITASHNPWEYNGVKFKASYGGPFLSEETNKIEQLLGHELVQASDEEIHQVDFREMYVKHIEELIDFNAIKESGIKVLIDSMNGAGQQIIENILFKHGIKSKTINMIADTEADRTAEPIAENLQPLMSDIKKSDYAFGIATDGDADRLGIVLENGEWLSAQETIILLADYIITKRKFPGALVKTSSVTDKLQQLCKKENRKLLNVQVGFKYICETMLKEEIAFGAEESGGYGFYNHLPERDGIFAALIFIEMIAKSGEKKLSSYVEEKRKNYGGIYYNRYDIKYLSSDRLSKIKELSENPPKKILGKDVEHTQTFTNAKNDVNGIKLSLEPGCWMLIRVSETEPMIRFYAEADSNENVENLLAAGKQLFNI